MKKALFFLISIPLLASCKPTVNIETARNEILQTEKAFDKNANPNAKLSWTPDFIGVSDCGTLGYTYGKYVFSVQDTSGKSIEHTGIFQTVWKKQNKEWRYVWD